MPENKKSSSKTFVKLAFAVVLVALLAWFQPVAPTSAKFLPPPVLKQTAPDIAWPDYGEAAIGNLGSGVLETHNSQTPLPTASVAKVFTALAVLSKHPLQPGQQGPLIPISQADVDSYNSYAAQDGSVAPVVLGEQISEYQAIEAMMLPSANNLADTLARWAFGSTDSYVAFANSYYTGLGFKDTTLAGASGFSPDTKSTAADLVKIGQMALNNPVLAAIVSQKSAVIPVAGTINNVNWLLGIDGINGIKTGNTDQAGGVYLFSSQQNINAKSTTIIGAVMGAPTLTQAMAAGRSLAQTAPSGFTAKTIFNPGQVVGSYSLPWGKKVNLVTAGSLITSAWYSQNVTLSRQAQSIVSTKKGQRLGSYKASAGATSAAVNLLADSSSGSPPWQWRLYQRYF